MKKKYLIIIIIFWIAFAIGSFSWEYNLIVSDDRQLVLNKSQAFFEQQLVARAWNAKHDGVYVPITASTQPNQYLEDSLRDIITVDGMKLTKINPAFMTRQMAEINKAEYDIQFHITSLNPIRPANKADSWETSSLKLFQQGATEVMELVEDDSISLYRYMAPLFVEEQCLKCHAKQGYKVGEIRGGISISFPATVYKNVLKTRIFYFRLAHLIIFIIGVIFLFVYYRISNNYFSVLTTKNNELSKLNNTKDKLFSIIAHDLQSPFNNILGFSDLLNKDYDEFTDETRKDYISNINDSSNRAFHLLKDLLLWAQSQTNSIVIKKEDLNLNEVINDAIAAYSPIAESKNISCEINVDKELIVSADKMAIKTVIGNIFINAVKFTPQNGTIIIEGIQKEDNIVVSISDSGVGIPPENLEKIFNFDKSVSTMGTNKEKGTGLGLIICKEFIEKQNGKIWAESKIGTGSSFHFSLPLANDEIDSS